MTQSGDITLATAVEDLPGVGAARARALRALGVTTAGRLLAHLPMRHERLEAEAPIAELTPGQIVSARGEISATRVVMRGKRPRFEAVLLDPTGRLDLVWFNQTYLRERIQPGVRLRVQGTAKRFGYGLQIANPSFATLGADGDEGPREEKARLRPVYPASAQVTSRQIEGVLTPLLPGLVALVEDHLPEPFRRSRALPSLAEAYWMIHAPADEADVDAARRRLAYDELLLLQLGVAMRRRRLRGTLRAPGLRWDGEIDGAIRRRFPFELTPAQDEVLREVAADLAAPVPTNRLIQGDVGSGKTVIALYAMLMAVASGHQAALMAPTEILAEQHFASVSRTLGGSRVRVELLTGGTPRAQREGILSRLAAGEVDVLIGTHALLTETVAFRSLAVAVIDEQHRFGVHQRAGLRTKGTRSDAAEGGAEAAELTPHVLVMTATPIPRTLAITLFGDLDISTIRGMPPGRTPIVTRLVGPEAREKVYSWLREKLDAGDQAYVVVPAIDAGGGGGGADGELLLPAEEEPRGEGLAREPEVDDPPPPIEGAEAAPGAPIADVRTVLAELERGALAGKRLAGLHGRLGRATRESIMERFRAGSVDALVSTTVIEVGVDVPNATVMVVEQADRFGLAQLHQLRGRVGRGSKRSVCVLVSDLPTEEAKQRLEIMTKTTDGFVLAEKDMELRGPGEFFGTRQSGLPPFKVADLTRDKDLLQVARKDAAEWIARSPGLSAPEEALLRRRLLKAYGAWLDLGDVG